jgi:tryptophanyl-tRNA synthetase
VVLLHWEYRNYRHGVFLFTIADLHTLIARQDPADLREKIIETAAILLTAGIDPQRRSLSSNPASSPAPGLH